jgi:hypothetical protein
MTKGSLYLSIITEYEQIKVTNQKANGFLKRMTHPYVAY